MSSEDGARSHALWARGFGPAAPARRAAGTVAALDPCRIVVVSGLAFEARLAANTGARICYGRGSILRNMLAQAVREGCAGIVSFGIAGGLDPRLRAGAAVVASAVLNRGDTRPTDRRWASHLLAILPGARYLPVLGAEDPIVDPPSKVAAFKHTGAALVDTESHLVAAAAEEAGIPFAVVRVVADAADRLVPQCAVNAVRPDGSSDALAVLRAGARKPAEFRHLIAVARDVWIARATLARARRLLDARFGLLDDPGDDLTTTPLLASAAAA